MERGKSRSVIREVVLLPLGVFLLFMFIMIISSIIIYDNLGNQIMENNLNALRLSLNQIENRQKVMDNDFIQYVTSDKSYLHLSNFDENTTTNEYFLYAAMTQEWLGNQIASYAIVDTVFAYYQNMDFLMFRGKIDKEVHDFVFEYLKSEEIQYNHWRIETVNEKQYLMNVKKYDRFIWGCLISMDTLMRDLGLDKEEFLGIVYIIDHQGNNTLNNDVLTSGMNNGNEVREVLQSGLYYHNHMVSGDGKDIMMGILTERFLVLKNMGFLLKILFAIIIILLVMVPCIIYWLQSKIARPLKSLDLAMQYIGEGDTEYRITLPDKKYNDEFDRLMIQFNQMMEDLNDLEFSLYRSKISEQRTKLKYLGQQIRPHFILNALNIIYTYEADEFYLVKKMVLYLSDYFKYIVNLKVDFVKVEEEIRHIENYLNIQKERYPDGFEFLIQVDHNVADCMLPPLIIQTFVENCIKYAMKNDEKLQIIICVKEEDGDLNIMVSDNGNGFTRDTLDRIHHFMQTREYQRTLGVGIQNAIERLDILYQKEYQICIKNNIDGGAVVDLYLPLQIG